MRTTIDLPDELLRAAKQRAAQRALQRHLEEAEQSGDERFELIVAGVPGGRHPSPTEVHRLLDAEDWSPPR